MKMIEPREVKSRTGFLHLISGIILILFFTIAVFPVSASGIEANREISTGTATGIAYTGGSFTVTVNISTDQNIEALALDENLPEGWNVNVVESAGATFQNIETFKESTLEWIWVESIQAGGEKTIVYSVNSTSVCCTWKLQAFRQYFRIFSLRHTCHGRFGNNCDMPSPGS
nr:hypothetical protein [Methanosarcina mazei]